MRAMGYEKNEWEFIHWWGMYNLVSFLAVDGQLNYMYALHMKDH